MFKCSCAIKVTVPRPLDMYRWSQMRIPWHSFTWRNICQYPLIRSIVCKSNLFGNIVNYQTIPSLCTGAQEKFPGIFWNTVPLTKVTHSTYKDLFFYIPIVLVNLNGSSRRIIMFAHSLYAFLEELRSKFKISLF